MTYNIVLRCAHPRDDDPSCLDTPDEIADVKDGNMVEYRGRQYPLKTILVDLAGDVIMLYLQDGEKIINLYIDPESKAKSREEMPESFRSLVRSFTGGY